MGKYFGTDGFRGRVNETLTARHAFVIGLALGHMATQDGSTAASPSPTRPCIVIGMDTRRSGEMFSAALSAGITAAGADVDIAGVIPTPGCAYVTRMGEYVFGVMISASHNPAGDNGIKIFNADGEKLSDDELARIEDIIDEDGETVPLATGAAVGKVARRGYLRDNYLEYLNDVATHGSGLYVEDETRPCFGWTIARDCAYGSASGMAPTLFKHLGAKVVVRANRPDGKNINVNCGSTHIAGLQQLVVDKGCDIGFAFDGDADRCLAVDAAGNVVDGDAIMYVCGKYLSAQGRLADNCVVATVMSNFGLFKALDAAGIAYEKTAVGDRFVYENMLSYDRNFGGEQSGHVIFRELATTGDGMLTACMILEALIANGQTLTSAVAGFTAYPQVLINVPVTDKAAAMSSHAVHAAIDAAEEALGTDGRVLVRPSGTEQLIRVMAEAGDTAVAREQTQRIADVISALFA